MAASEEDQVRSMLEAMGVGSIDETVPAQVEPPPAAKPVAVDANADSAASRPAVAKAPELPAEIAGALVSAVGATGAERRGAASGTTGRDVPVSTVVHLMGLPTAAQLALLEGKIDILTTRVTTVTTKLERIASELSLIKNDATTDRIDFQLNDIRGLLRRLVPKAAAAGEVEPVPESPRLQSAKARILSSEPTAPAADATKKDPAPTPAPAKKDEKDALEEFQMDNGDFQANEGRRVRQEMK